MPRIHRYEKNKIAYNLSINILVKKDSYLLFGQGLLTPIIPYTYICQEKYRTTNIHIYIHSKHLDISSQIKFTGISFQTLDVVSKHSNFKQTEIDTYQS